MRPPVASTLRGSCTCARWPEGVAVVDDMPVMRAYTRAFKIPVLIGKIQGWAIPGGPYTLAQVLVVGVLFLGGMFARPVWSRGNIIIDAGTALVFALPIGIIAGKLKVGARDPFSVGGSLLGAITAPEWGVQGGRPLRWERSGPLQGFSAHLRSRTKVLVLADELSVRGEPFEAGYRAQEAPAAAATASRARQAASMPQELAEVPDAPVPSFVSAPAAPSPSVPSHPVTSLARLLAAAEKVS
jgi:hypothetical protein